MYDLDSGGDVATFQLGGLINDVVLTQDAAWFTDSTLPHLYRIPTSPGGSVRTVVVSLPGRAHLLDRLRTAQIRHGPSRMAVFQEVVGCSTRSTAT